jgi:hypothetical protein
LRAGALRSTRRPRFPIGGSMRPDLLALALLTRVVIGIVLGLL